MRCDGEGKRKEPCQAPLRFAERKIVDIDRKREGPRRERRGAKAPERPSPLVIVMGGEYLMES